MRRLLVVAWLAGLVSTVACGARELPPAGQIVLYVDTDAPLPAGPGETLAEDEPTPLFDRIRIEVFAPGSQTPCVGCTHDFDLDRAIVRARRASVGLTLPPYTSGYRARVRMFRSDIALIGDPSGASVEQTIALPQTAAEGIVSVTALLRVDDVAHPRGTLDAPIPAELRTPEGLAGTWPSARRVPCSGVANPGEVCVPGGAAWASTSSLSGVTPPRIVVVSPFFYDATEVTVAAMREAKLASEIDPMRFDITDGLPGPILHCTYTTEVGNDELLPVNCVSWSLARRYCQKRGADLPTRAQFEYAASGLVGRPFVWGNDLATCADAVYARSWLNDPDRRCLGGWVEPPGAGARDRLELAGGVIVDLAGNLSEYALDMFAPDIAACAASGVAYDPVCTEPTKLPAIPEARAVMGGSWVAPATSLASSTTGPSLPFEKSRRNGPAGGVDAYAMTSTGFRCARSAR